MSRQARALVDVTAFVAVWWMWIAIYESFTRSGLWAIIARAVGGATTLPVELAVLVLCVAAGWLAAAAAGWMIWCALVRRAQRVLPPARVVTRRRRYRDTLGWPCHQNRSGAAAHLPA